MSLLSLNKVVLYLSQNCILDKIDFKLEKNDRIAIVGRNGAGKSSFLKLLQGHISPDSGKIHYQNGLVIAGLIQDVPISKDETVYHFLVASLGELGQILLNYHLALTACDQDKIAESQQQIDSYQAWDLPPKIQSMAQNLGLPINACMNSLSGGMRRKVLLASALLLEPDLLLLDEPTNHLDIDSIKWLEEWLKSYSGSILFVTHDRKFLQALANRIVEIDRAKIYSYNCDYSSYLDRREARILAEKKYNNLFDKRLQEEEEWLRQGVKARRARNEGRVLRLKELRATQLKRREELGKIKSISLTTSYSGKIVLEAQNLNYTINGLSLLKDFSLLLTRGDKVGIVGPNGCGKTTLVRLLLGELKANSGTLKLGTNLEITYFEQLRHQLDEQKTVMQTVADGAQHVNINGQDRHVSSYLQDFLFNAKQLNQAVSSLSGGERSRLLLAKLFAKPSNFLVMDEPSNDLDLDTLELLEKLLIDYTGTLLLISHDREFINQIVNSIVVYEGDGQFKEFIGSYDDYLNYHETKNSKPLTKDTNTNTKISNRVYSKTQIDYKEQKELKSLPIQIEKIEKEITKLHAQMGQEGFYQQEPAVIESVNINLKDLDLKLQQLYKRWEDLESRK